MRNSIQAIIPGPTIHEELRLHQSPAQKFWKDGHAEVFGVSLLILVSLLCVLPPTVTWFLRKCVEGNKEHRSPDILFKIGVFYAPLNDTMLLPMLIQSWSVRFTIAANSLLFKYQLVSFSRYECEGV